MLRLLLLFVITYTYPCSDDDFQECHFISSLCKYTNNYINDWDKPQIKFEYQLELNSSIYCLDTFIYENVLSIFIYHDKYPNCESLNLLKNKTVDCIICPDVNTGLILNPNYKNIIDRINYGLMIIFSVLGAIIVVISIASILVCACKK